VSLAVALTALATLRLSADPIVFTNKASFLSLPGATAEALIPNLGLVSTPVAIGNLTFSLGPGATQMYLGTGGPGQWSTLLAGNDIALSGFESLNVIDTVTAVYALGFDFHEPSVAGVPPNVTNVCNTAACVDSTFAVTLKMGAASVGTFSFNAPDDVAAFIGVWNPTPFNRVEIVETTGSNDNEFYGQFYTSTSVPEPSAWVLLATCLGLVGALRRRS
jgi:hypothetical protein